MDIIHQVSRYLIMERTIGITTTNNISIPNTVTPMMIVISFQIGTNNINMDVMYQIK